jgi:CPA2 family monovalent cation:H+ antiporter-2
MEEAVKNADLIPLLYKCILLFGIAGLIVPLFNRIHVSPVLGFLICGILISPNLLNPAENDFGFLNQLLFVDEENIKLLGELGVLALLFMIGLELSMEKLAELKKYIFGLGMAQILGTGIVIGIIALLFGNNAQTSIIIGIGFALSSTAIIMQLLRDYNLTRHSIGRMGFSILLMQDMAVVPILIMIGAFAASQGGEQTTPLLVLYSIGLAIIVVGGIWVTGKKILQPILCRVIGTKKDEWLASFSLFILCLIAVITQAIGLSAALGAFLAGLLIAETEFSEKIEAILMPIKSVLLGIFFISIGMMVDVFAILDYPLLLALSVVGIFLVKGLTLYPLCRLFGIKDHYAREIATILCQPGEFTLMIISLSLATGLLAREDGQFFLLVCVLGMIVTPLVFKAIPSVRKAKHEDEQEIIKR